MIPEMIENDGKGEGVQGGLGGPGKPAKPGSGTGGTGGPGGVGGVGGVGGSPSGQGGQGGPGGPGGSSEGNGHHWGDGGVPRWVGVVLIVLALATVGTGWQDRQQTKCQAQYNSDFAASLMVRNQWSNEDRASNLKMWEDVLAGASPEVRRQSVVSYIDTIKKNDALRAKTPLPKLEQRNC